MLSNTRRGFLSQEARLWHQGLTGRAEVYLEERGIPAEVAGRFLLGIASGEGSSAGCKGRLSIPYLTPAGCVGFKFRSLDGAEPKYLAPAGQEVRLFNAGDLLAGTPTVVLCEGELDAVVVSGVLGVPAVGVPGANSWKRHWDLLLEPFERVVVAADGDDAGQAMAEKVRGHVPQVVVAVMPDGHDASSVLVEFGEDELAALLRV
jgi:DNA primase